MKVTCSITGLSFHASEHFKDDPAFYSKHPIFSAPIAHVLAKGKKWSRGSYNEEEEKLIFLALLSSTERVSYEVPAYPSVSLVNKHMQTLFSFISWYHSVKGSSLKLPDYRVTMDNYDLSNIGTYIASCYDCRQEWMMMSSRRHLQDLVEKEEYNLSRLIFSGAETSDYSGHLWRWIVKVLSSKMEKIGPDKLEEWGEIFKTKPNESIFKFHLEDIELLQSWLAEELFSYNSYSAGSGISYSMQAIKHINSLYVTRRDGWLGLITNSVGGPANTFSLHLDGTSGVEDVHSARLIAIAPLLEPRRNDYIGRLSDYMKARAAWTLSSMSASAHANIDVNKE